MKRHVFILGLILISFSGYSQIRWIENENIASNIAIQENKFIVMDFWATWCGPCKLMDREMWGTEDINAVSSKFVPLKVDVDFNRSLAIEYNARSIPMVVVIDPIGNEVWKEIGYSSSAIYYKMFDNLPECAIRTDLINLEKANKGNPETWMEIGLAYQKMGKDQEYVQLQNGMLSISDQYFKQVASKSSDPKMEYLASLNQILNDAYRGRTKNALKQLAKIEGNNSELADYIKAYCYKCLGNKTEMEKYKKRIKDQQLLAQLQ
jgi:thiol-disulfide isomerase/thioredoxin